jgi:uncharacterized protein (TIGR03437 family)
MPFRNNSCTICVLFVFVTFAAIASAAPDRILRPVDSRVTRVIPGNVHALTNAQDQGAVDPSLPLNYVILITKPSAAQQADLDRLLADQQNPSSPQFHKWLTPEQFGDRFGLSSADGSKVATWLRSQGLSVKQVARGRNWLAFGGKAAQVSTALHTSFHNFVTGGETHFANITDPAVPDALADVVWGFLGLNDFHLKSYVHLAPAPATAGLGPEYSSGGTHYLVPQDFATIYDIMPLYQQKIDGEGQSIAVVGVSDVDPNDLAAFRTTYGLPANNPVMLPYAGSDPGYNGAQVEGTLDVEWSGAIAPQATIYYVYGPDPFQAVFYAVDADVAPVISISYGGCELGYAADYYRSIAQQANALGITILGASGDSGAAGCDAQGDQMFATQGMSVDFPAVMPEVTGVGGTQFVEGNGSYWSATNSPQLGSALSYIPEAAWNESGDGGLLSGGGGASIFYSKPAWQSGPGVPSDAVRDVPDVAFSAALHDAYYITLSGNSVAVAGTSCAAPSMAGIVALLNQHEVTKGSQARPGLGNINPQLYRLAQSSPSVFHDVTSGSNVVPCAQGSPDCLTGSFGYQTRTGYDQATGLGSLDVSKLAEAWNTATDGVIVKLYLSATTLTVNDTLRMTAVVSAVSGSGTPTSTVDFSYLGSDLGSVSLSSNGTEQTANLSVPAYLVGSGVPTIYAVYSGDAEFSGGSATAVAQINVPSGAAAIVPVWPVTVWPLSPDAQGLSWQTSIQLSEMAGVAAIVTGFTIDGQAQSLSQYFPSPQIQPSGSVSVNIVFRNLAAPMTRTFGFAGVDSFGNHWSRQLQVTYMPPPPEEYFTLNATPLTVTQNVAADASCQWAAQLNVDDVGGYLNYITGLYVGGVDESNQIASIFGTTRIDAYGDAQGALCFGGITPPATDSILVILDNGYGQEVNVSFGGPPAKPVTLSATPSSVSLTANRTATNGVVTVNLSDPTQTWTASVYPANRTTAWLNASQLSGTGSGQIVLSATGTGFEPGVYRANIVIQSQNATPQYVTVPVMLVLGGSSGTAIASVGNAASFETAVSPGMLLSVFGTQLANTTAGTPGLPLPFTLNGVSVTVNGVAAPILYESAGQLNIQAPYTTGAGPAVLGVNNNGQIAGFQFQMSPSSPGVFADSKANLVPNSTVVQGVPTTLYLTGAGDVTPQIATGFAPDSGTPLQELPAPFLPLSVTIAGVPAFIDFAAIPYGLVGATQVNFQASTAVPLGVQPLVVTVNGVASKPVNVTVTASAN